ncbi:MAG: hypothetical protein L0H41_17135 [Microlunatus sp.]|nr:hypothetical protein [Microlunatus sp.]MDN5771187.1 hypothetical protein [Microlunatus sp.]
MSDDQVAVTVQMLALDFGNSANNQLLWELTGDPMECHYAGARWVERAAKANPSQAEVYRRFLDRISGLADQPPPESGITAIINKPLRLMWSVTWPWAPHSRSTART